MLEAHIKIIENEPKTFQNFGVLKDLAQEDQSINDEKKEVDKAPTEPLKLNDNDQKLFFGEEFSDAEKDNNKNESNINDSDKPSQEQKQESDDKLISYDDGFEEFISASSNILMPSQLLMDDSFYNMPTNVDLLGSLMPSQASNHQENSSLLSTQQSPSKKENSLSKNPSKKSNDVSKWFELFSDLDPLNQQKEVNDASENMHAA